MTQDCWGSPMEYMASECLVEALLRALDLHLITKEDIQFGTDQQIWDLLLRSEDPLICEKMQEIFHVKECCCVVDPSQCDLIVKRKFRGLDPWVQCEGSLVHLTEVDPTLGQEYREVKELMQRGWGIKRMPTMAAKIEG